MALKIGDKLPRLTLKDQDGENYHFSRVEDKALVIFFYPKDFTPGCTKEACSFRDHYEEFQDLGAEVIGISTDNESSHKKFASKHQLPFVLLSDKEKRARQAFGVKPGLLGLLPGRETFVFDKDKKLIHRFNSMGASQHIPEALNSLKKIQEK
ncbi:peroxiredoxin [Salegentibacter salegens]|uniref:thioredoxin-dependent peroxiredoxin n=1 Tax=Salegentibacter salegens TaxID=143223 RepID=A0A1M7NGU3_9FLAO|nr:peroxiredoxin [Salegentibacter salegens]PRX46240.1 peroxiredoxin Q/BCP [Salegentibacter salegens]SHN02998.1 peroxiredoxin Q/BCP [Salegentibacter salegens]